MFLFYAEKNPLLISRFTKGLGSAVGKQAFKVSMGSHTTAGMIKGAEKKIFLGIYFLGNSTCNAFHFPYRIYHKLKVMVGE